MNPWLIVAFLGMILGAGFGGFKLGVDHEVASQSKIDKAIQDTANKNAEEIGNRIAAMKPNTVIHKQTLEREIKENVVYRECKNTPKAMETINSSLSGSADGSKLRDTDYKAVESGTGSSKLPAPESAAR